MRPPVKKPPALLRGAWNLTAYQPSRVEGAWRGFLPVVALYDALPRAPILESAHHSSSFTPSLNDSISVRAFSITVSKASLAEQTDGSSAAARSTPAIIASICW